ncbi:MAG: nicotinamide riboside transporter PnuC [Bacteroidota bacterium]|nr:nicotinamide riboside transporter PnuC [Bacteroidota bacterium]
MNDPIFYFEVIAVLTGILSVWLTRKENVILYPVGICSVSIWIYLCWIGDLFGQSIINFFFLLMNLFGWYNWQLKDDSQKLKIQIKNNNNSENLMVIIASIILSAIVFVVIIQFQKEDASLFYVILESIITGLNFTAKWLMAWPRIVHWYLWIIGDIMCIPLFVFKNYTLGVIQFAIFIVIAYQGLKDWKIKLQND